MHEEFEKQHTRVDIVSLSIAHQIARNSPKVSGFTYHSKKITYFSGGGTAIFQLNKHISISSSLGFALRKFTDFFSFFFLALKYTPITGLLFTEILQLHALSVFFVRSTKVRAGLLFSALTAKTCKIHEGRGKTV